MTYRSEVTCSCMPQCHLNLLEGKEFVRPKCIVIILHFDGVNFFEGGCNWGSFTYRIIEDQFSRP